MPKWMDDCVKSVKKENPSYSDSRAWAICTTAYKKKFGHPPGEGEDPSMLTESYRAGLVVESVGDEGGEFAYLVSGAVIPAPKSEYGTYSRNHRLYPKECVRETFRRSLEFLQDDVATMHISHDAAGSWSGKLPVGKITELWMDDGALMFRCGVADTADSRDLRSLIESGILERVSLRTRSWSASYEEVGDYGEIEVMEWLVLHGIDFTEVPGIDGTQVTREHQEFEGIEEEEEEEQDMDLKDLTLVQLQEGRPDLIAEIVDGNTPEPTVEFQTPPDVALEIAMHRVSNAGTGSLVFAYLQEHVEDEDGLTDEVLQEAREHAAKELYGRHTPAPSSNLRGDGTPAPEPPEPGEGGGEEETLSESQQEILSLAGSA